MSPDCHAECQVIVVESALDVRHHIFLIHWHGEHLWSKMIGVAFISKYCFKAPVPSCWPRWCHWWAHAGQSRRLCQHWSWEGETCEVWALNLNSRRTPPPPGNIKLFFWHTCSYKYRFQTQCHRGEHSRIWWSSTPRSSSLTPKSKFSSQNLL